MNDNKQLRLPHRDIRPGSRWTESDIEFVRSLLGQREGLGKRNDSRQRWARLRRTIVRLAYDMVRESGVPHKVAMGQLTRAVGIKERQVYIDLDRQPSGDLDALKAAGFGRRESAAPRPGAQ